MGVKDRLQHAWNAFMNKDPTDPLPNVDNFQPMYSYREDRPRYLPGTEKSIVSAIYTRIAVDSAAISIKHVRLDDNERYLETINSGLNECLNLEANKDQTGRSFVEDIVMSMLDEGCVAVVPVDTNDNMLKNGSFDILSMRTAKVTEWGPDIVNLYIYNDRTGQKQYLKMPKNKVAIIENPFYAIMNEPNSTLQRLKRTLSLKDTYNVKQGANRFDIIFQYPYSLKREDRQKEAKKRVNELTDQLVNSDYGIGYIDSTEKVVQLNRPIENQLQSEVEYLTKEFFSQTGMTQSILDGTADENTLNNYYNRMIEPIMSAIVDEFKRKFLTKTARSQKQSIMFFRDPFKLIPASQMAEITDKFTRNEVMTANEVRQIFGMKPASDPGADELRNKNISMSADEQRVDVDGNPILPAGGEEQMLPEEGNPEMQEPMPEEQTEASNGKTGLQQLMDMPLSEIQ